MCVTHHMPVLVMLRVCVCVAQLVHISVPVCMWRPEVVPQAGSLFGLEHIRWIGWTD